MESDYCAIREECDIIPQGFSVTNTNPNSRLWLRFRENDKIITIVIPRCTKNLSYEQIINNSIFIVSEKEKQNG